MWFGNSGGVCKQSNLHSQKMGFVLITHICWVSSAPLCEYVCGRKASLELEISHRGVFEICRCIFAFCE